MRVFDLRSDTITKPTKGMREAMAGAEVGDDVYREDPTMTALENRAAALTGKERALFVSSGCMGNLIALFVQAGRGKEVLTASSSHIIGHEIGSMAAIAGTLPITIDVPRGILSAHDLEGRVKGGAYDAATTAVIAVENTIGGVCYPIENLKGIRSFADAHHLNVHMDGARIFNAQVATGIPVKEWASWADTITFCLSKGLGAPIGSLLCGSEVFIREALTVRKMLGGGMRQTGILAAAGLYALDHHIERLADDHRHARMIAESLERSGWAQVDMEGVETNIIFFTVPTMETQEVLDRLKAVGILANTEGSVVRLVTNLDISLDDTLAICALIEGMEMTR
ncbi:MAG TPA: GntG family PLP-dependent aldolase [Sphaerochaeta sp.]|mgnify:FL=1|jgi:threonine aldolase|nr:GntG family PLP-dependent aldolase [Sphaerochaeta sp.]HPK46217.1 GntG family PLP-dependent aldolase [Sphaerochaeta sp.]